MPLPDLLPRLRCNPMNTTELGDWADDDELRDHLAAVHGSDRRYIATLDRRFLDSRHGRAHTCHRDLQCVLPKGHHGTCDWGADGDK